MLIDSLGDERAIGEVAVPTSGDRLGNRRLGFRVQVLGFGVWGSGIKAD